MLYQHNNINLNLDQNIYDVNSFLRTFQNSIEERKNIKVLIAMSGGVDSSVLAVLLHKAGFEVIGITFQLYDIGKIGVKKGACCAGIDIYDAQRVSQEAGFKHYILNKESKFDDAVIQDFIDSYFKGETPLPCANCNQELKIPELLRLRKSLKADVIMTGHYARIFCENGQYYLYQGKDVKKDQTYFLGGLTQEHLKVLDCPLGNINKNITRQLAKELNIHISDKPDSQDICFIPNNNYSEFIRRNRPEASVKGDIIHIDGYKLGEHEGIINYTIGQRKGLGISSNTPLYVIEIKVEESIIIVGPYSALAKHHIYLYKVNIINSISNNTVYTCKLRSTGKLLECKVAISNEDNSHCTIELVEPDFGIAPGQVCVVYDKGSVMLSGVILKK